MLHLQSLSGNTYCTINNKVFESAKSFIFSILVLVENPWSVKWSL